MNYSKIALVVFSFFALGVLMMSCGSKTNSTESTSQSENQGMEYTSAYVCPMHCEGSGSDQPGTCPVCGMDYVKNETDHYACPMHPDITGKQGDKCSVCGMDLTIMSDDDHKGHNH